MVEIINEIEQRIFNFFHNHRDGLWRRYIRFQLSRYDIPISDQGNNGATDSSGNLTLVVYQNNTQRDMVVSRLYLWADGFDPSTPYNGGVSTWAGIFPDRNANPGNAKDFLPTTPQGQIFPNIAEYGEHDAPRFKSGESVVFAIFNGPANKNINVKIDGWLKPAGVNEDTY